MTLDLTAARICRAARRTMGPAIDEEIAREDASRVRHIIACVRRAYAIQPTHPGWRGGENDTIETILRTVGGVSPEDHDDACNEGEWMMFQLTHAEQLTGERDLYKKWLGVCGDIENVDYDDLFSDDENDPAAAGVTFEDEDVEDEDVEGAVVLEDDDMTRRFRTLIKDLP